MFTKLALATVLATVSSAASVSRIPAVDKAECRAIYANQKILYAKFKKNKGCKTILAVKINYRAYRECMGTGTWRVYCPAKYHCLDTQSKVRELAKVYNGRKNVTNLYALYNAAADNRRCRKVGEYAAYKPCEVIRLKN
jgi:hypothetical protein